MMLKAINLLTIFDVNVKIHVKNSQHYDFILGVSNMIKRDFYINKLINSKGNGKVKVITGLRRCGKSYLLFKLYKEYLLSQGISEDQIIAYSLEGYENIHLRNINVLYASIKARLKDDNKKYYLFIDEIQNVHPMQNPYVESKDIITFVDLMLEFVKLDNLDIYITGSNSKMLSKDILTQFRGRTHQIRLLPLSFNELYNHFGNTPDLLDNYFMYGGMPEIYTKFRNEEAKKDYLKYLFEETYIKDVLERNNIQNDTFILGTLLDFISSSVGSLISPSKISNRFLSEQNIKISSATVDRYLEYFDDAFVLSKANRYDISGARYYKSNNKYYYTDVGLRNARLNFPLKDQGHIMENIIYINLIKRGYKVDVGIVHDNYRVDGRLTQKQLEVDFMVTGANERYYIQSVLTLDDLKTTERETRPLNKIKDNFIKIVVIKNYTGSFYDKDGIFYINLKDFLLNENLAEITKRW